MALGAAAGLAASWCGSNGQYVEVTGEGVPSLPLGLRMVSLAAAGALPGTASDDDGRYVMKALPTRDLPSEMRRLIEAEGEVLRRVGGHPGIVALRDLIPEGSSVEGGPEPAIVLEYLAGGDCGRLLERRGRLPEPLAAALIRQVLAALAHCHACGVVHRDVHPGNVLLVAPPGPAAQRMRCKLIDFAFAGELRQDGGSATRLTDVLGNAPYVAPEVLARHPEYDEKVDVWSLGATAFELLTGAPPFGRVGDYGGYAPEDRLYRRVRQYAACGGAGCEAELGRAEGWKTLSTGARRFLRTLLEPDPGLRPGAAEACQDPWLRLAGAATPLRAGGGPAALPRAVAAATAEAEAEAKA